MSVSLIIFEISQRSTQAQFVQIIFIEAEIMDELVHEGDSDENNSACNALALLVHLVANTATINRCTPSALAHGLRVYEATESKSASIHVAEGALIYPTGVARAQLSSL
jgi:hypothetical protein